MFQPDLGRVRLQEAIYKTAKMALYRSPDYQTSFNSIGLLVQEKKFNIDFQDDGFRIRMILATFDL